MKNIWSQEDGVWTITQHEIDNILAVKCQNLLENMHSEMQKGCCVYNQGK
jgi:hypothetical protein